MRDDLEVVALNNVEYAGAEETFGNERYRGFIPARQLSWLRSDLAAVLPTQLARYFAQLLPLQLFDLPFELNGFQLDIVSLAQRQNDNALRWLIEQISATAPKATTL